MAKSETRNNLLLFNVEVPQLRNLENSPKFQVYRRRVVEACVLLRCYAVYEGMLISP